MRGRLTANLHCDDVLAVKALADSWTDEFTRLEDEADFWEKLQKHWDDLNGFVYALYCKPCTCKQIASVLE